MQEIETTKLKDKQNNFFFQISMALLLVLICLKNAFEVPISAGVLLLLVCAISLFSNKENIVILGACFIPLSTAFQYKYALLMCMIIYIIKYPKDIKLNHYALPLFGMMTWELLHALRYDFVINEYFRNFSEIIFCTFLMLRTEKKVDYGRLTRYLAVCTICMISILLWGVLKNDYYTSFESLFSSGYRLSRNWESWGSYNVGYNANELGYVCLLPIAGLLQLIVWKKQRWIDFLFIAVLLFFGALSVSRAFFLCAVVLGLMFVWEWKPNLVGKIQSFAVVAIIVTLFIALLANFTPYIVEYFVSRFQRRDVSGGRNDIFLFYNQHIFSKMEYTYFGIGLQNVQEKIWDLYGMTKGITHVPHNGLQELVLVWGIPGLALFGSYIWSMIQSSREVVKQQRLIHFIPLLLSLLIIQSLQLVSSGIRMMAFAYIYIGMCVDYTTNKQKETTWTDE